MKYTLEPINHEENYTNYIEREVQSYFSEVIYLPLLNLLKEAGVKPNPADQRINAGNDALRAALDSGRVHFADGTFSGQFNAAVSKQLRGLGATFDTKSQTFKIKATSLPLDLRNVIYASVETSKNLHTEIANLLLQMQENVAIAPTGLKFENAVDRIVTSLNKQFIASVKPLDGIGIPAEVTPAMRQALTSKLTHNLDLSIKNFAAEKIPELRAKVEANVFAGYRTDRLAKIIEADYGVSKRKARFLADQETSLLVAKYREERAADIGSVAYIWDTMHDARVRHDHKELNGRQFFFSDPPVSDRATGRRCNPGEDFGCRCRARIVVNWNA